MAAVWKPLKERFGLEIDYAWTTFVWDSEATEKAHVHVVIVGFHVVDAIVSIASEKDTVSPPDAMGAIASTEKRLFHADGSVVTARHINGYLMDGPDVFIENISSPVCDIPPTNYGSFALDDGNYTISEQEYTDIKNKEANIDEYLKPFIGAQEFLHNKKRYCVWLTGMSPVKIRQSRIVLAKIEKVRTWRSQSTRKNTVLLAETPTLFAEVRQPSCDYIAIPTVCSERRKYIPMGFLSPQIIASNQLYIVPNATLYHFGVLTSSVHMAWMRVVAGRLEMRYRYSAAIVYNNFPWPEIDDVSTDMCPMKIRPSNDTCPKDGCGARSGGAVARAPAIGVKSQIEETAQAILDARALYPDSSLADLYDPLTMPPELRKAHQANDAAVMKAYGFPPDLDEAGIVSRLFEMYAALVEKAKGEK